jgi:hypothetical protein
MPVLTTVGHLPNNLVITLCSLTHTVRLFVKHHGCTQFVYISVSPYTSILIKLRTTPMADVSYVTQTMNGICLSSLNHVRLEVFRY